MMAAFFGLIAFSNAASSPRFETFHTLDVIRLMTAGAGLGAAFVLVAGSLKLGALHRESDDLPEHEKSVRSS
jgi:hypothetical protein